MRQNAARSAHARAGTPTGRGGKVAAMMVSPVFADPSRAAARLVQLRWTMLGLAVLASALAAWRGVALPWALQGQALATLALLNLALQCWPALSARPGLALRLGLGGDVLALTELLAFSGGAANPLASLYLPPVLFAALLLPGGFAWWLGGAALAAYAALFFWHLPWPLAGGDAAYAFSLHLVGMWLTFALSVLLIVAFVSHLARQLMLREEALRQAREAQLRQEQLVAVGLQAAAAAHSLSTPLNTMTLLVDDMADACDGDAQLADDLALMRAQLADCRDALSRLKHGADSGAAARPLFDLLDERLAGWRSLRPDVELSYRGPAQGGPRVSPDPGFWPALFNLLNNAADAGGGRVELTVNWEDGRLLAVIVNRQGCLSDAQLARAGLAALPSDKPAGMGLGVLLSHVTLSRLGGRLHLANDPAGGVCARLELPLEERA